MAKYKHNYFFNSKTQWGDLVVPPIPHDSMAPYDDGDDHSVATISFFYPSRLLLKFYCGLSLTISWRLYLHLAEV